mgnify:FL=1
MTDLRSFCAITLPKTFYGSLTNKSPNIQCKFMHTRSYSHALIVHTSKHYKTTFLLSISCMLWAKLIWNNTNLLQPNPPWSFRHVFYSNEIVCGNLFYYKPQNSKCKKNIVWKKVLKVILELSKNSNYKQFIWILHKFT